MWIVLLGRIIAHTDLLHGQKAYCDKYILCVMLSGSDIIACGLIVDIVWKKNDYLYLVDNIMNEQWYFQIQH